MQLRRLNVSCHTAPQNEEEEDVEEEFSAKSAVILLDPFWTRYLENTGNHYAYPHSNQAAAVGDFLHGPHHLRILYDPLNQPASGLGFGMCRLF